MNSTPISVPEVPVAAGLGRIAWTGLASGAVWALAASISAALSQWLLLMVTAKLGSAEMVGQLAMSFAIVAPIQVLTDLALRPALATDAGRDYRFRDYFKLRGMMLVVFLTAVTVAAWFRGGAASAVIITIGLQKAVESASDLFFGLFQREDRLKWMGQSVVMRSTLASLAFVGVMVAYGDLVVACLAGLVVRIGVFLLHDFARGSELLHFNTSGRVLAEGRVGGLLKSSLPLAVGLFLMSFAVNIPRYAVEKRLGVATLGIFAALVYVFQAGAMLIDAVGQAACQRLAKFHLLGDQRAFRSLLLRLGALAGLAAGCGILIALVGGAPLLRFAYSAPFAAQARPFLLLSVCAVPWYCSSVFGYGLVARRQMTALFYCQVVALGATLAGAYWLIGGNGLSGACEVVFLTYSTLLVLYSIVLWRDPDKGLGGGLK